MKLKRFIIVLIVIVLFILSINVWVYFYNRGMVRVNYPNPNKYPVAGVDVSNHQGDINWDEIAKQNVSFAFIKATEGSTFTDHYFDKNWHNAQKAGIRVGAYHFFSFDSPGSKQAKHFIDIVPITKNMLPPAVDVEPYGEYILDKKIDIASAKRELRVLIDALKKEYGMTPIIYSSFLYNSIIKDDFDDCDIWDRSVYLPKSNKKNLTFWQYSDNHILEGYSGPEKFIDMNVFVGSREEFERYPEKIRR